MKGPSCYVLMTEKACVTLYEYVWKASPCDTIFKLSIHNEVIGKRWNYDKVSSVDAQVAIIDVSGPPCEVSTP